MTALSADPITTVESTTPGPAAARCRGPYHPGVRVVSLLPSATETICALGAGDLLVGRSHECDHPPSIRDRPALTGQRVPLIAASGDPAGTGASSAEIDAAVRAHLAAGESLYHLDVERLHALRPDAIVTQDLCDVCSIDLAAVRRAAEAMAPAPTILSLDPRSVEDVLDDVLRVGELLGRDADAARTVTRLRERMGRAADHVPSFAGGPSVCVLEWTDPPFAAGHWTPQLVERAGGRHPLNPTVPLPDAGAAGQGAGAIAGASRQVTPDTIAASEPEIVVVCPCGLDLAAAEDQARLLLAEAWFRELPAVCDDRVWVVDGSQMFNRPGPRLVDAFEWLVGVLQDRPELAPPEFPARWLRRREWESAR